MSYAIFDRPIFNIILIHVSRTWERIRLTQPYQEMPLDNIQSTDAIQEIATELIKDELIQKFIVDRIGDIWNTHGDGASDSYIERLATDYIKKNYL